MYIDMRNQWQRVFEQVEQEVRGEGRGSESLTIILVVRRDIERPHG